MIFQLRRKSFIGLFAVPARLFARRKAASAKTPKPKGLGFLASYEHMLATVCDSIVGKGDW